jgi:four helix bundle protein
MSYLFIPTHGGYRKLLSYKKAEIIYDGTIYFTSKFLLRGDRTVDQMVQAARSGKQNIAEGSLASATSKEMEIKLTNVARASQFELLIDFEDYLRTRHFSVWPLSHPYSKRLQELNRLLDATYDTYRKGIENTDPTICANVMIGLIKVCCRLLERQLVHCKD